VYVIVACCEASVRGAVIPEGLDSRLEFEYVTRHSYVPIRLPAPAATLLGLFKYGGIIAHEVRFVLFEVTLRVLLSPSEINNQPGSLVVSLFGEAYGTKLHKLLRAMGPTLELSV
jgi:hypothetical protein